MNRRLNMDINSLVVGLSRETGNFLLAFNGVDWVAGIEFGREAVDSPMAGGAAYGLGATAEEAISSALAETGWNQ
jgi:hypothetical protein